jgi:hypothetical protein
VRACSILYQSLLTASRGRAGLALLLIVLACAWLAGQAVPDAAAAGETATPVAPPATGTATPIAPSATATGTATPTPARTSQPAATAATFTPSPALTAMAAETPPAGGVAVARVVVKLASPDPRHVSSTGGVSAATAAGALAVEEVIPEVRLQRFFVPAGQVQAAVDALGRRPDVLFAYPERRVYAFLTATPSATPSATPLGTPTALHTPPASPLARDTMAPASPGWPTAAPSS